MAIFCCRIYYKYLKYLVTIVIVIFFTQLIIALYWFPSENDEYSKSRPISHSRNYLADVSARKISYEDDEDLPNHNARLKKQISNLRVEELDFKPACNISSKEAISAIHRAKTQNCKKQIVDITCLIQEGNFYPKKLSNSCAVNKNNFGEHLGCFRDEKKLRLLSSFYGNFASTNSPSACLDLCVQAGFSYAGVQYASECFCGETRPATAARVDNTLCDMKCPADPERSCGGYFTMNVYETGLLKFEPRTPQVAQAGEMPEQVRIIFLLILNGRALRQVNRLLNSLYRTNHYFYIHVDARQDYLHRKLAELENKFPNIKLAANRFSTIWGGASLLQMILASMRDFFALGWQWDYVINLSESDFPIKSLKSLEIFLSKNKGLNFVKSHGREVQRFIKKQGLDKTFLECETHMWRIGDRKLPKGVTIDGGSDWIALSPEFVSYIVGERDDLLTGLDAVFRHTLLPAESFFHIVLRNSRFCSTYVDNNLHVTNWKRKLGCKCQYKHVVDWCGCSPNDFRAEDWPRILNTQDRQLFFARKFEPIINQEIITRVEKSIGFHDHHLIENLDAYWQNIYDAEDLPESSDDVVLSHARSLARHNARLLQERGCRAAPPAPRAVRALTSYSDADIYKGNLILHLARLDDATPLVDVTLETWYKPQNSFSFGFDKLYVDNIKIFRVSSHYDQKEMTFRNNANILGPLSEPILMYQMLPLDRKIENFTVVWVDPAGLVADVNEIHVDENNLTNFIKPNLKVPLLPGIWKVGLMQGTNIIVHVKFLITPLEYFSGKDITTQEVNLIHGGSQSQYKNFSNTDFKDFLPSRHEILLLQKLAFSNSKRVDEDLREWIDSLTYMFYSILGTCINVPTDIPKDSYQCGNHALKHCSQVRWSSLSPDPKGHIGILNPDSGRLERV